MQVEKSLFEGREGWVFHLQDSSDAIVPLTLTRVESPGQRILQQAREQGVREPFSVLFRGPLEPYLSQQMVVLNHQEIGEVELFLVPVNQDESGYYYEAILG